ncbi:hypothetical protein AVEN_83298-1 [Araneus ventricosus]|uniref:Uncharacterized protein n=1 Tax=Araneus ventricosus TaxID=182803 RepID=A0A4Y2W0B4_ARAVE|nr:hypothetical protein AVEN_83298-1 [Araneus ventricosus]
MNIRCVRKPSNSTIDTMTVYVEILVLISLLSRIRNIQGSHRVTPVIPAGVPGSLNDCRRDSSSTEAGILVAITGHGPTPPEGGAY